MMAPLAPDRIAGLLAAASPIPATLVGEPRRRDPLGDAISFLGE